MSLATIIILKIIEHLQNTACGSAHMKINVWHFEDSIVRYIIFFFIITSFPLAIQFCLVISFIYVKAIEITIFMVRRFMNIGRYKNYVSYIYIYVNILYILS